MKHGKDGFQRYCHDHYTCFRCDCSKQLINQLPGHAASLVLFLDAFAKKSRKSVPINLTLLCMETIKEVCINVDPWTLHLQVMAYFILGEQKGKL